MADWQPAFRPANAVTYTASAEVTGGDAVEVTGAYTVAPAGAASTKYVGIAAHNAAVGEKVLVHLKGKSIQRGRASGAIAAGAQVATAAAGAIAAGATAVIGVTQTATTAAGQTVEFLD